MFLQRRNLGSNGEVTCEPCPQGYHCLDTLIFPCQTPRCGAPPGYYLPSNHTYGDFLPCPEGTYSPYEGLTSPELCLPCPGNRWSSPGSWVCTLCRDGWLSPPGCMVPVQQGVAVIPPPEEESCLEGWYIGPHVDPSIAPGCTQCPYQVPGGGVEVFTMPGVGCEVGCAQGYELSPAKDGVPDPEDTNTTGYCHACTQSTHIQAWGHDGTFTGCVEREPGGPSGDCPSGMEPVSNGGYCMDCEDGEYVSPSGCRDCPRGSYCPPGVDLPVRMPPGADRDDVATPGLADFRCGRGHFRGRTRRLRVNGCCSNTASISRMDGVCDCTAGFDEDMLVDDSTICVA